MKRVAILGASGSIGTNTLEVIRQNKDKFELVSFSVYNQTDKIEPIIIEFKSVYLIGVKDKNEIKDLINKYPNISFYEKDDGLNKVASSKCDIVVNALVGFIGLKPTLVAIENNKDVALANKETLVAGGEIVLKEAKKHNVAILPVDSEHSAIFQCLEKENKVKNIVLTASGGPFFKREFKDLENVSVNEALNHPTWKMGSKITIDSATMFNKAFEIIEAYYLFDVSPSKIKVIIHPQSIVHSLVTFKDNAMKAELGVSDMKIPIAYALNYPIRLNNVAKSLKLDKVANLTFYKASYKKYKPLALAYKVLKLKKTYPCVLNAANEEAVKLFLNGKIKFIDVYNIVEQTLNAHTPLNEALTYDTIVKADLWAREYVRRMY